MDKEEAMKILKDFHDKSALFSVRTALETLHPELKESEDEKIRKELIEFFSKGAEYDSSTNCIKDRNIIAWLEKQGEQKPAWNEEDEEMCQETIDWFEKKCFPYALENDNPARESIKWLKSLKNRVLPQPKQEWSEEDQNALEDVREAIVHYWGGDSQDILLYWLKSIKQKIKGE